MISNQSYLTALSLAGKYAAIGMTVTAKPDTVVNDLVSKSIPPFPYTVDTEESLRSFGDLFSSTTKGTIEEPTQHELTMDGLVRDLSKLVTSHISFAKNTVKPMVVNMATAINEYRQNNATKQPSAKFNIITLNFPELLRDSSFLDTLTPYQDKTILTPDLSFSLAGKTTEEITAIMYTGHARTDKLIGEWLSAQDSNFVQTVWDSFFTKIVSKDIISFVDLEKVNAFDSCNYALGIYLIARKLFDQVEASDMNLSAYKNTAVQIRDYAGAKLAASVKKVALFEQTKMLVLETQSAKYTAKVNGSVYREWIAAGGSPDVILGLIVSGKQLSSQSMIDASAVELKKQWESYCTFASTRENNNAIVYYREFLTNTFNSMLNDVEKTEAEYILKNPSFYSNAKKLAETTIESIRLQDMDDVYGIALALVARCRYYYTSSYSILNDINEAAKVNPNVDVREAALLAAINYLSDYVACQLTIKS